MTAFSPLILALALLLAGSEVIPWQVPRPIVVDDFQDNKAGRPLQAWKYISRQGVIIPLEQEMNARERFFIVEEAGNRFVRVYTEGEALRTSLLNDEDFTWNLRSHSRLRWRWRACRLPQGGNERQKGKNDSGGALYVTFSTDWLGRPKSIKYVYSATLATGTVISYGPLKVVVAGSAVTGHGAWERVERDVAEDYRRLFGGEPPVQPLSITLWGDSDSTRSIGEVDFDDITLLPKE